jgi:hypothetical protein
MRVLMTNNTLDAHAGSEMYLFDVARSILARGHQVVAYSPRLGNVAAELRAAGVEVVDDLARMSEPPDVIHGQHHLEAMTAFLHFGGVPGIYVLHGGMPWVEHPPRFPRIRRYVVNNPRVVDRLVLEHGISRDRVAILPHAVDLDRFRPRGPLPRRPGRALVFSNAATEGDPLSPIRVAAARSGMTVEVVGHAAGTATARSELVLGNYDLVFAYGRAAREALAVGTAVIVCEGLRHGPMVSTANVERMLQFGMGTGGLAYPLTVESLSAELERYDPDDAASVSRHVRSVASLEEAVSRLVELYEAVLAEHVGDEGRTADGEERRAAAAYLTSLVNRLPEPMDTLRGLRGMVRDATRYAQDLEQHVERRSAYAQSLERQSPAQLEYLASLDRQIAQVRDRLADGLAYLNSLEDELARRRAYAQTLEADIAARRRDPSEAC